MANHVPMVVRAWLLAVWALLAGMAQAAVPPPSLKPEPPELAFVSREEAETLRTLFEALDDRNYANARALRLELRSSLTEKIGEWAILASKTPGLTLSRYDAFLDRNPGWPNPNTLRRKAEALIDDETPEGPILAFFSGREPLSGYGKLHLARALLAIDSQDAAGVYAQRAWIEHNFNAADSRAIVREFGRFLSPEVHFAKADRALFQRSTAGVEDVEGLLDRQRQREVDVRIAALRQRTNATELFNALPPASQRDPGVLHAMVRYLRRTEREDEAFELAALAPLEAEAMRDPGAWFYERKLLARWALKNGRFDDAYTVSAYSGLTEGADFAEAEFMAGWVALRFLNDPTRARAHFSFLTEGVSSPISLARGNYWLARAYKGMGQDDLARAHFLVAADYPYTFYGQMAVETLGPNLPPMDFPPARTSSDADRAELDEHELARAIQILNAIDQPLTYRRFALALDEQLATEGQVLAFAEMMRNHGNDELIVRAGKVARSLGMDVPQVVYPLLPVPAAATQFAEAPLILGLSRQESEFRVDAVSSANAKGMMQLLNSTARATARKEGLPYSASRLLTDADYNMTLGAAHLSHLLERFEGSYIMILAAYNAGSHRVDQWVETYGDPRDPSVDPIDWIELIPFSETRNYVMRVLENTQVYRARIDGLPLGIQLVDDITRGERTNFTAIGQPIPAPTLWHVGGLEGLQELADSHEQSAPLAIIHDMPTHGGGEGGSR
ncbi:MAG: lytic transglycosylase domain-containing protein [Pseudomonadota bacterium]